MLHRVIRFGDSHLPPDRLRLGLGVVTWVLSLAHSSIKLSAITLIVAEAVWRSIRHHGSVEVEKELGNEALPDLHTRSLDA